MSANLMSLARSGGKCLKLYGDRKMMKTMPTAKDYIQDGLVAMWDGIENAGWGVHNPNATVWTDLTGNLEPFQLPKVATVGTNYIDFNHGSTNFVSHSFSSVKTIEVGFSVLPTTERGAGLHFGTVRSYARGLSLFPYMYIGVSQVIQHASTVFDFSYDAEIDEFTTASLTIEDGIWTGFTKASQKKTVSRNEGFIIDSSVSFGNYVAGGIERGFGRKALFSRLYNRALTDAEIAANYAIDKARFNLPD